MSLEVIWQPPGFSVQESEHPKRNPVAISYFGIIYGKKTVRHICYLVKGLSTASYLKQIPAIDKEIALLRICHIMTCPHLVEKEGFPFISFIH